MGRESYQGGGSGFAGGSLGLGAANVVNEDEAAVLAETVIADSFDADEEAEVVRLKKGGEDERGEDLNKKALMGICDSRSHWYASSVEMVTCPDTYPVWRTRKPVVIVLPDPKKAANNDTTADSMEEGVYHHRYRYLVVTPGAENEGSHGLNKLYDKDGSIEDISHMLNKTKISSGCLTQLAYDDVMTSSDVGASFPVTLWENPFLEKEDVTMQDASSREFDMSSTYSRSGDALSLYSEATSVRHKGGGVSRDVVLANLPYRALDIDTTTLSAVKRSSSDPEYTEDGILVDNWNGCNDITFGPYRTREGLKEQEERESGFVSSMSEGDTMMAVEPEKPRRRIFLVCYHLPVIVSKNPTTGEWTACWAESILAKTANSSFVSSSDAHWVGTVTTSTPITDESDRQALRSLLATMDCTVLFFDQSVRVAHYKGFCKQVLWLAFHHVDLLDMRDPAFSMDLDATSTKRQADGTLIDLHSSWDQRQVGQWWEAFKFVNNTFAVEVAKMVQPDDVVWVHDYHLSLFPRLLGEEEKKNNAPRLTKKIFFLHIPFPASMLFKEMECGPDILEGILHADVVGFHGFTDARHFLSCAKRILGLSQESFVGGLIGVKYQKRTVAVTMSSVSVEPYMIDGKKGTFHLLSTFS